MESFWNIHNSLILHKANLLCTAKAIWVLQIKVWKRVDPPPPLWNFFIKRYLNASLRFQVSGASSALNFNFELRGHNSCAFLRRQTLYLGKSLDWIHLRDLKPWWQPGCSSLSVILPVFKAFCTLSNKLIRSQLWNAGQCRKVMIPFLFKFQIWINVRSWVFYWCLWLSLFSLTPPLSTLLVFITVLFTKFAKRIDNNIFPIQLTIS